MRTTRDLKSEVGDLIQCEVCPVQCKMAEGKFGRCMAVKRRDDELELVTYGHPSGFCVDPIEKKPLYHFLPGSPVLSFGTIGCNLTCRFCQNWNISTARAENLGEAVAPEQVVEAAMKTGCRSIACTYNDPVAFFEYAVDVAHAANAQEIKTVLVTNGYIHGVAREQLYEPVHAANIDLKAFTDDFYRKYCGGRLQPVLDTIDYIRSETDVWLELTTLLIPGENDSEGEIRAMCAWLAEHACEDVPIHFSAFHPSNKLMDKPRTPLGTVIKAREWAMAEGMRYVYTGNVIFPDGEATSCPKCGQTMIERSGYEITQWNLEKGACGACGETIAGVFDESPGTWGNQRQPVYV